MLKTTVFAGHITNLTDARYFAARGAQYLSFDLDEEMDTFISPQQLAAIKEWVSGPKIVGAFRTASPNGIVAAAKLLQLDLVQTTSTLSENEITALEVPVIRESFVEQLEYLPRLHEQLSVSAAPFEILHFHGNDLSWDLIQANEFAARLLKEYCSQFQLLLHLPHQPGQITDIVDQLQPHGLYVQGGAEEKTGFKSFDELDELFDVLELEE